MSKQIDIDTDGLTRIELKYLLKENTGVALCDSGGAYGRHWEKNQNRDFDNEPTLKVDPAYERSEEGEYFESIDKELFKVDELLFIINIYHFLFQNVEMNSDSDYLKKKYYKEYDDETSPHLALMEQFVSDHNTGIQEQLVENTYNFENALSQDIQFGIFTCTAPLAKTEKTFIILQIHQGCDIRGGYTDPTVFELMDFHYFMMGMTDIEAFEQQRTIDYSKCLFSKKELDKLKTKETRCWDSDDAGMSFHQDGTFSEENETLNPALYHDDLNDIFYMSDTLNIVEFMPKFEIYG